MISSLQLEINKEKMSERVTTMPDPHLSLATKPGLGALSLITIPAKTPWFGRRLDLTRLLDPSALGLAFKKRRLVLAQLSDLDIQVKNKIKK
jgi:hypothetical protein